MEFAQKDRLIRDFAVCIQFYFIDFFFLGIIM